MAIIGAKEIENGTVSVRSRESSENEVMKIDEFIEKLKKQIENKD